MIDHLAHAAEYHTVETSTLEHWLLEPIVLRILFLLGIALIGFLAERAGKTTPVIRGTILCAYTFTSAIILYPFDKIGSYIAIALGIFSLALIIAVKMGKQPKPKKAEKLPK